MGPIPGGMTAFRSTHTGPRRRRPTGGFFSAVPVLALLALLALASAPLAAQQPTRPDTARAARDTTGARADTMAPGRDTTGARRDTTRPPPPQLPELTRPVPPGFASGVWVFTRDSIEHLTNAVTLADLLEMLPGVTRVRAGYAVQPEVATAFGETAGRVRVFLDGYELAPLSAGVTDLARIEMAEVESVRVERRLDELRVDVRSLSPSTGVPYAYIQAGVAEPNSKLFRAAYLTPRLMFGPAAFGIDRVDTDGTGRSEPADMTAIWGKWTKHFGERGGIQAELRTSTVNRGGSVPWPGHFSERDLALRGRWRFSKGLVAEAYAGSSSGHDTKLVPDSTGFAVPWNPPALPPLDSTSTRADTLVADSIMRLRADTALERSDRQLGARVSYVGGPVWGDAAVRSHSATTLPGTEGDATLGLLVPGAGDVDGGVHMESWRGRSFTDARVRGRVGPFAGVSAFAELSSGERGVPFARDSAGRALATKRTAWRAGGQLEWGRLSAGLARVSVNSDSFPGFGLPFDPVPRFVPAGRMDGWESYGRVRVLKPLYAEVWYQAWTTFTRPAGADSTTVRPLYAPDQQYRASLVYHQTPLPSGNLELYARLDARSRGLMFDGARPAVPVAEVNSLDFFMQIRILDVRLFFQEVGLLQRRSSTGDTRPYDVPGRFIPSPRIFYGVRWQFFD